MVSTRWSQRRAGGLLDALREHVDLGATHRVEIDAPAGADDVVAAAEFARGRMLDVVAVAAPFFGREAAARRQPGASLCDEDPTLLEQARRELGAAVEAAARFRSPRVSLAVGGLTPSGTPQGEARRARGVERLCRELWTVFEKQAGLRIVLRPESDILRGAGVTEFEWVLGEFDPSRLGFALDVGVAERRARAGAEAIEAWERALGDRLQMIYLSDATDVEDGLPLGAGLVDPTWIARLRERGLPTVLKLSEGASRLMIEESLRQLA